MIQSNQDGQQHWAGALMNNYGTPKLTLVGGSGTKVWDADGKTYLDLLGGIAVTSLGHCHPNVVAAVTDQVARLGHVSNFYATEPVLELAEKLLELTGFGDRGRVLLCNSGTEANEAAFKIARRTGRSKIISTENGFHGRTMGALAMTGQPAKRAPFEPMPGGVEFVPYGDIAALQTAIDGDTAAVILEPIQGEGGVFPAPDGYLQAARQLTSAHGALLILDEIQTGIGRTGSWFAFQKAGIEPDVITLAKGLGGGLPIGACLGVGDAAALLEPGQHGTTFGGNPICAAAALAVLNTIAAEGLLDNADRLGKDIIKGIEDLDHPLISGVRGSGMLIGIGLSQPIAPAVNAAATDAGYLINPVKPDTIRLAPALLLADEDAHRFIADLPGLLEQGAKA
ncbi:acetylornithine transaminase [Pseudonocardiaceae bacterium YIM PH 21723]|nr:acetylornithine transaminase [Pseudonocardiaceae bacterium YIM PH 21723]